ncbi:MAG: T9SS C-terminal target domain-containing protein [Chitinophagaceae bacterium]|nr:MAG: T9SS C-terminal target domain-containing protein [Chitinophagaceae bacterium]
MKLHRFTLFIVCIFAYCLLAVTDSFSQAPDFIWAKTAEESHSGYGQGISTDANGNVVVIGRFSSPSISFGSTTLTKEGGSDIFVVKYDPDGNVLWARSAGGDLWDEGYDITTDAKGNILITGTFLSSSITFGSTTLTKSGNANIFVVKYDPDGNVLWARSAGGGGTSDEGYSISTDTIGNVLVTGFFSSPSITFDSITLTNSGNANIFIVKYDPDGNVLWAQSAEGSSSAAGWGIATDGIGNILVTGSFWSPSITLGSITLTKSGERDLFVVKYDSEGNVLWAQSAGGENWDEGYDVAIDSEGNTLLTGYFQSPYIVFGSDTLINQGDYNIFVVKYDPDGNTVWAHSFGGNSSDISRGITTDARDNVLVTGYLKSQSIAFGSDTLTNENGSDVFVVKYSPEGNFLWVKSTKGIYSDRGYSISTDKSRNVFLTGSYLSYDMSFDSINLTNAGSSSFFVAKIKCSVETSVTVSYNSLTVETDRAIYRWLDCDNNYAVIPGAINQTFTPSESGNYAVQVNDNGCIDTSACYKFVFTSSEDINHLYPGFTVYPNPSTGIFILQAETLSGYSNFTVYIYNMLGEIIHTGKITSDKTALNLSTQPNGIYWMHFLDNEQSFMKKIIIGK